MMLLIVVEVAGTVCDADCSIFSQTDDRPSVGLAQVVVLLKWLDGPNSFLAWRFLSTSPTVCYKGIHARTKITYMYFPFGTFLV